VSEITTDTPVERDRRGRFVKGAKGGPGRPKGSPRNVLAQDFLHAMAADFAIHGAATIEKVRTENPTAHMRACVDLLPKEAVLDVNVDVLHDIGNVLEAFRVMNGVLGADPEHGMRRLKRIAPQIGDDDVFRE
jgi:hypothetical protein